jgi:hypothetical protein
MTTDYIELNHKSRARLIRLVNRLSEADLGRVIYKEGWTVAVVFAHLAFWDERRRLVLKRWREKGISPTPYIDDIVNDVLIPLALTIPLLKAAQLAVTAAEALDKEIEELPEEITKAIEALNEPKALDRASHRHQHLDEIEALLKTRQG